MDINLITRTLLQDEFDNFIFIKNDLYNFEYEGFLFTSNNEIIHSRLAKKTNKKQGYFVTFWNKRNGKNIPYSSKDEFDYLVINIIDNENQGYLIFSKDTLIKNNIITHDDKIGKMGFRVYPFYNDKLNDTAKKTHNWQKDFYKTYSI